MMPYATPEDAQTIFNLIRDKKREIMSDSIEDHALANAARTKSVQNQNKIQENLKKFMQRNGEI